MEIYLGTDHAGFELKEKIKPFLLGKGLKVTDCGAFTYDKDDDYPIFIEKAAVNAAKKLDSKGIIFGKSGTGECIVANKIKGIRAVLGFCEENVKLSRLHNNANVLSLGSQFINEAFAKKLILIFLNTKFSNEERHIRRINLINEIENNIVS